MASFFFRVESKCAWPFLLRGTICFLALAGSPLLWLLSLQWLLSGYLMLLHLHRQEARQQEKLMLLKVDAEGPGVPCCHPPTHTVQSSCVYFMDSTQA